MRLDFETMVELAVPGMNGGSGEVRARMHVDGWGKVIRSVLPVGGTIGLHGHPTSVDVNFVVKGRGVAMCDGVEEDLALGVCHVCPQGASHSIANTGDEDLVLLTVVPEQR